jgi:ABC-type branched-subunit amino acid transport system substrate-binding protein
VRMRAGLHPLTAILVLALLATSGVLVPSNLGAAQPTESRFGTLPSPCGPGHATGATDQGVTASSIRIAYGDDRGFTGDPGLNQEMGDAVKDMIAWCNAQGGIEGRKIVGDFYDAAVTNVENVMTQACKSDFMLVGEGFGEDSLAEPTRLECNLAAVPGYTGSPVTSNAYEMYQAMPTPDNYSAASMAYQASTLFGDKVQHVGIYDTTLPTEQQATVKLMQAYGKAGWTSSTDCSVTINYSGEPDYTPFMQKLKSCGAQVVYFDNVAGPILYGSLEAANQIGYDPIWMMESAYTTGFAQWNTQGLGNNVYVHMEFEPFEAAKVVPAVAQYLSILKKYGGLTSELGEQSTSSFLLWATEAKACGSELTRQCMINHLAKVTSWTGGGLNAPSNPAKNLPPSCGLLVKLDGTKWVQAYPKELGSFDCSSKYVVQNSGAAITTALNAQGYATESVPPSIIKPEG